MHSVIHEIIRSTEERVKLISYHHCNKYSSSDKRGIVASIEKKRDEGKVAVISEVKPASPRRKLRDIPPEDAAVIARMMEQAGAVAISVLTEPQFFRGSLDNLLAVRESVRIPVLRKDFIINEIQVEEVESDMILLIVSVLGESVREMVRLVRSKGMEPLVEVHDQEDLISPCQQMPA